jgi:hypothetical protein
MPLGALAALALLLVSLPAAALIVDIDARENTPAAAVEVALDAGAYTLVPVDVAGGGTYTATNFWNIVERCDETGGDCRYGWIWQYVFASESLPETQVVADGRWATPELAFANAFETSFDLYEPETLRLYFIDNPYDDNLGGVSLDVVLVPEPGRAVLVLSGALGLAMGALLSRRWNA